MDTEAERVPAQADSLFERAADVLSRAIGTEYAFGLALAVVIGWAVSGTWAGFSNTWQLFINTFTTISTFLMVFLLANASNRLTENQDEMLAGIYGEEHRLETEEELIRKLVEKMDARHIRPILKHLDEQDRKLEEVQKAILAALRTEDQGTS